MQKNITLNTYLMHHSVLSTTKKPLCLDFHHGSFIYVLTLSCKNSWIMPTEWKRISLISDAATIHHTLSYKQECVEIVWNNLSWINYYMLFKKSILFSSEKIYFKCSISSKIIFSTYIQRNSLTGSTLHYFLYLILWFTAVSKVLVP